MIEKKWINETARDIIALGSIVFYFLVVGRALVGPFWVFFTFLSSAAVILFIIYLLYNKFDLYLSRGTILTAGTIYFYSDFLFTVFASAVYLLMIISSSYLGTSGFKIIKGIILGAVSTAAGYAIVVLFFEKPWI